MAAKNGFCHIQLTTGDLKVAQKFYRSLFDWKLTDLGAGMGHYVMVDTGSKETGGGMQPKDSVEMPSMWMPYVEVPDVKKAVAKAKKLGAEVIVPFQPIPGMGAMGVFVDPTGAPIGVWEPEKPAKKKAAKKPAKKRK